MQGSAWRVDPWDVDDLTLVRWRRYGKDRLYANVADGSGIGWHDLVSGETHVDAEGRAEDLVAAVQRWRMGQPAGVTDSALVSPAPAPAHERPVEPVRARSGQESRQGSPWTDLADRRPGAMARERAVALRDAAPVRTLLARVLGVHTEERAWRIGADGEEAVAAQLEPLVACEPRWRVLHAVPVGDRGSDVDHVVIGPGGVFTLNAKNHPGAKVWLGGDTVLVAGQRVPHVRNSRHEASRASRLLTAACGTSVPVTGVVVLVGVGALTVKVEPVDVAVVPVRQLAGWMRLQPAVLSDEAIEDVHTTARRSTTWTG